jgi:hypothetical protein
MDVEDGDSDVRGREIKRETLVELAALTALPPNTSWAGNTQAAKALRLFSTGPKSA